jgi:hypothetical protein
VNGSNGRLPITALTCAGPTKPSSGRAFPSRSSGLSSSAMIAGGVSTWLQCTLKLVRPRALACCSATAVGGVVVSKPMAKNTTCRSGWARATVSASRQE